MEERMRQLAIGTSQNYPTQYSEELPAELISSATIRQLDSITVRNFKSFRREHYIGPFLKFTSVVGPNGSGKSNILEALFFCICGEKQKGHRIDPKEFICKTEGESLLQFDRDQQECWVQARFLLANGGYLLARRQLLPTGQSRYFINGREYPQKIYQQYLTSQGLLSDVCNFAIFQGETDRMAAIQPKDLRNYLETLSGSYRYKEAYDSDKQELERLDKLIEQNTGKVTRLKQEKRNIKQIRSTTTDYERLAGKLSECVETQYAAKVLFKELDLRKLQKQIQTKKEQEARIQEELAQKKAQMQRDYKQSVELQTRYNELQEQRSALAAKLKLCNSHESTIKQRQLSELQAQLRTDQEEQELLTARMKNLQGSLPTVVVPEQLNEYLSLYQQWEKENFLMKTEVEKKQMNIAAFDRNIISKEEALNKMKEARRKGEVEQAGKHRKVEELTEQLTTVRNSNKRIKETIAKANEESRRTVDHIAQREKRISAVNQSLQDVESRLLEGLEQNKLRELFKKLMTVQGFKGRIADKIKPTNKKYAQCFGQLMAPIENSLLVENEQAAKDLAARLKDLCSIKNVVILSNVNDKDQNVAAFRRELGKNGTPAADIVDFDRDLNGLEGYLMLALKGKAVCDSLDDAFRLRQMNLRSVKQIYTLDGSVLRDDGMISISGQQSAQRKTYRFDAESQKKLQKEMATLQKQKEELEEQIKKLKERVLSNTQLSGLMNELNSLERKQQELLTEVEYWKKYKAKAGNDHEFLETELRELKLKRDKLRDVLVKIERSMADSNFFSQFMRKHNISDLSVFRSGKDMKDLQASYQLRNRINSEVEAIVKRVQLLSKKDLPNRIARLQGELEKIAHVSYRKSLQDELERKEREVKLTKNRLDQLTISLEPVRFKSELPELTERHKFLELQKQLYQRQLAEIQGLNLLNPNYDKPLNLLKEDIDTVKREQLENLMHRLEPQRKSIEAELEKYNSLAFYGTGGSQIESVELKVKQLEEALDASVEARDKVKQRLAITSAERSRTLIQFIEKLKIILAEAYRILTETSDSKVYGHADLYLEDQEQPFMGGIYYSPTPPSKRFVYDVDQLSGGEKSLASIALQFSAAVASKAPFIMLDESDAFLDNENVNKLINLIFRGIEANGLQFVVVSHKQPLFGSGDSLVGAMNRERSSRVFSLRLDTV